MGGIPCIKLLANSGGVIGLLTGISNVVVKDGDSLPYAIIEEGEKLICGFHAELEKYEQKLIATVKA